MMSQLSIQMQTRQDFGPKGMSLLYIKKSLGSSIMVSDFIVEGYGYLKDDTTEARLLIATQKDGYFNSDMFLTQVDSAIDI